jgi:hypothetical protein
LLGSTDRTILSNCRASGIRPTGRTLRTLCLPPAVRALAHLLQERTVHVP